jgi:tetratricopeptide (TPR) repeat protein
MKRTDPLLRIQSIVALFVVVVSLGNSAAAKAQSATDKDKIAAESLNTADSQFAMKNYSKASENYTIVIGLTSSEYVHSYALRKRGDAKLEMQDYKGALEDYEQSSKSKPGLTPVAKRSIDLTGRDFDSSIYRNTMDVDPLESVLNRAFAETHVGDKVSACEVFRAMCPNMSRACAYAAEYCIPKTSSSTSPSIVTSLQTQLRIGTYTLQPDERLDFKDVSSVVLHPEIQIRIRSVGRDGTVKAQFDRGNVGDLKGDLSGTIDPDDKLLLEGFLFGYSRREFKTQLVALVKGGTLTKGKYVADSSSLKIIGEFNGSTFSKPDDDEDKLTFTSSSKSGTTRSPASFSKLEIGTYTADAAEIIESRGLPTVRWNKTIQIKVESLDNEGNIKVEFAISGTKGEVSGRIDNGGSLQLNGYLFGADRTKFKFNMTTTVKDGRLVDGRYVLESKLLKDTGTFNIAVIVKDDF